MSKTQIVSTHTWRVWREQATAQIVDRSPTLALTVAPARAISESSKSMMPTTPRGSPHSHGSQ
ncbi:hypothetical protein CF68_06295 [Cupriavidus sp. SK-4]|uniref:hypothetical protein n=1 Tax=Cupriavidus sp. SK-4 TaxID=574750 RepID=UPI00044AB36C|nr:hypothetical protein [Cupriavidus sp. SK-4]EYS86329.1 hypothetical protein CF68_06295 [Cupriavidus sp. SK-4]